MAYFFYFIFDDNWWNFDSFLDCFWQYCDGSNLFRSPLMLGLRNFWINFANFAIKNKDFRKVFALDGFLRYKKISLFSATLVFLDFNIIIICKNQKTPPVASTSVIHTFSSNWWWNVKCDTMTKSERGPSVFYQVFYFIFVWGFHLYTFSKMMYNCISRLFHLVWIIYHLTTLWIHFYIQVHKINIVIRK